MHQLQAYSNQKE